MSNSTTAKQILSMLDDKKRHKFLIKLWGVIALSIAAWFAASQWESPLAIMPQTASTFVLGCLYIHMKSVRIYPKISKYFDLEALTKDAESGE